MNWNEIKEKYPESWNKLREWRKYIDYCETQDDLGHYITDGVHRVGVWIYFNKRDLYDFFDEQGIHIMIRYERTYPDHEKDEDFYNWEIELEGAHSIKTPKIFDTYSDRAKRYAHYKTRTEAEEQAFLKAFEILEDRI